VKNKCVAKDHSTQLIRIVDALGDPPFWLLHRLLVFDFSIFAFWFIGRYSTTLRNCSMMHRLLPFITNLIISFSAQQTGTLGECPCFASNSKYLKNKDLHHTPNLNFWLSSSKTQVRQFKKNVSNSATQDSIMNAHTRLNLLMQRSNVYSKLQVMTHHYQRISSSPYLLQMQVQAQL
ncbi:hypothetical protein H5410_040677, partial [Solanum commersonii]